jgi:hypothetical protein
MSHFCVLFVSQKFVTDQMASVHKFPAVKTGRQGEFGAGAWRGSKQLQGLAIKGGTEEKGGNDELEH